MTYAQFRLACLIGTLGVAPGIALAQQPAPSLPTPPAQGTKVPEVQVIQPEVTKPKVAPQAVAPKPKSAPVQTSTPAPKPAPVKQAAPKPKPAPVVQAAPVVVEPTGPAVAADGRIESSARPSVSPITPSSILPKDTQNLTTAGNRVDSEKLAEQRPLTNHELLKAVPGVILVEDDGLARHSGISIRGSNFRRSRKVLVQEDGQSINYSTYIDASTHYTPPTDRIENVEVLRGTVISQGPLNNHGVVNFQNLSPFGKPETVIKGALSYTENSKDELGNYRHVRTRKQSGNFGVVLAYTGAEAPGAWDNERLRFNDFYGAFGWRDSTQDLTFSAVHFRQRDNYDEDNFVGTTAEFFANGNRKDGARVGTDDNTFNANATRLQLAHNYRFDGDTTLATKLYASSHVRNRYLQRSDDDDNPYYRGRERDYKHIGIDSRVEFANRPFIAGMTQDIQAGIRFERHTLTDCSNVGELGVLLGPDRKGNCTAVEGAGFPETAESADYTARSFAAFAQTAIHVNKWFTVTPGVRFENYDVKRATTFSADPLVTESQSFTHVLPGVGFAFAVAPKTTAYGGYHRGFAPNIVRDAEYPLTEEIGDNFQLGLRSKFITGLSFDAAVFHSQIKDYQDKASYAIGTDNVFGSFDKVELSGFELGARVDSRPITGGVWNVFAEAAYTYTDGKIKKGEEAVFENFPLENVSGNRLPFTIQHFANLTVGLAYKNIWDMSLTATYRGDFFTNGRNDKALTCIDEDGNLDVGCTGAAADLDELVGGKVASVWLLSARSNLKVSEQLSLFVSGTNLTNELYITELSDGAKPGQGRTLLGGFTYKFD